MAIQISAEEYKKKFGVEPSLSLPKKPGFVERTKQAFSSGVAEVKAGVEGAANSKNPVQLFENSWKIGSGAANAAFSPVSAAAEPVVKPTFDKVTNKISDNPTVQKFANTKAGNVTSRIAEDVMNLSTIAGTVGGSRSLVKAPAAIQNAANKTGQTVSKGMQPIKNVARDITPTKDRIVNSNVTKSLDLTSGDASNFFQSFGEDVGRFIADRNLIRANKDLTVAAIKENFDTNYKGVRAEIAKVKMPYKPSAVPRYTEALKTLKQQVDDVPGLQEKALEVDKLLAKKTNIELADIQRVKELIDDAHSIYKKTGDVKDGLRAEGLNNIRKEIKEFIEVEVKKNTGTDIQPMNKNVGASKELLDMVEIRSPRGLTKANVRLGDWATVGAGTAISFPVLGFLAPLGGIAAVFVKKAFESPAIMLRIAKKLDKMSDAEKAKIKANLEAGKIPQEFNEFIKQKPNR